MYYNKSIIDCRLDLLSSLESIDKRRLKLTNDISIRLSSVILSEIQSMIESRLSESVKDAADELYFFWFAIESIKERE